MATAVQLRRGTTTQVAAFTGLLGELVVDTDKNSLVLSDGSLEGGYEIARADFSNIPTNASLTLGTVTATQLDVTATGDLRLQDSAGGQYAALQAPSTISSSYTLTMPAAVGASGQALRAADGSGGLEWYTPADVGDITSVVAGAGLTGGGTSGAVTLNAIGTSDRVSVSADAIDIASTYAGQTSITTLGTIASGTWQGTAIANAYLANSTVNFGGVTVALGASDTTPAFNLSDATAYPGDSSFVTAGTIATGVWQGTAIAKTYVAGSPAGDYVGTSDSQTLTNKTLTTPVISTISNTGTLTLPTSTDTLVGRATTDTLTNKTLTSPVLNGSLSGTAFLDENDLVSNSQVAAASQASIKTYVDSVASGLDLLDSVHVASTAALTVTYANGSSGVGATLTNAGTQAALSIDGQTLVASERVLIKDQAAALQNGIYTVTNIGSGSSNWVLTRSTDFDTGAEMDSGSFVFVETGTTNADSGWVMTTDGTITVGSTALDFTQFSKAADILAGDGLTKTGSTIDAIGTSNRISVNGNIDIDSSYVGQASITTLGTIGSGIWQGTAIADTYVTDALTISGGTINNTVIGGSTPAAITATTLSAGATTFTAGATITVADNSDNLSLISTDADDNSGPNLRLYRNSANPADADVVGQVDFEGRNDNSQDVRYGFISAKISDASDGSEDGQLRFFTIAGGTETQTLTLESGNATFAGTLTASGGSSNNNDDANALSITGSEHLRAIIDTSSTSGHRASLVLESNGQETVLSTTGSASNLDVPVGDFTLDVAGDIVLDAGGGDVRLSYDATQFGKFTRDGGDFVISSSENDKDIKFAGADGGANITALTLDMSEGGNATFAGNMSVGNITVDTNTISSTNSNGNIIISPNGTGNVNVNTDVLAIQGTEGEGPSLALQADESDDAGDEWRFTTNTDQTLSIKNNISGSEVDHLTLTPHATVASSMATFAGKVGIGATADDARLQVFGSTFVGDAASDATIDNNLTGGGLDVAVGSGTKAFQVWDDGSTGTPRFSVLRNGNVLINTTDTGANHASDGAYITPDGQLVGRASGIVSYLNRRGSDGQVLQIMKDGTSVGGLNTNGGALVLKGESASAPVQLQTHDGNEDIEVDPDGFIKMETAGSERMRIDSSGNVGIGEPSPNANSKLEVNGRVRIGAGSVALPALTGSGDYDTGVWWGGSDILGFSTAGSERMRIDSGGAVTIGGSVSKGSGSFKIDHPLESKKDTHHLVHSFIEGPQADLIYRGTVDLVDGSATVNIDTAAGMTDGTFVLLNTNVQVFTSNESGWTAIKGSVSGNVLKITSQESCTDTISWMVVGERHDKHMKDTNWTDSAGKVIVEPLKDATGPA